MPPKYFSGMKAVFRVSFPDVFIPPASRWVLQRSVSTLASSRPEYLVLSCVCVLYSGRDAQSGYSFEETELCFLCTDFSKSLFAGDRKFSDKERDVRLTEICLCEEIRTKIRRLVVEELFACRYCFKCGLLLPRGCCHMIAVWCHVEMEFLGSR